MHNTTKIHHPGVKRIDRLAHLLENHALNAVSRLSSGTFHTFRNTDPGVPHPHPATSYPHLFHQLIFCFNGTCNIVHQSGKTEITAGDIAAFSPHTHYAVEPVHGPPPHLLKVFELGHRWTCFTEHTHSQPAPHISAMANVRNNGTERKLLQQLTGTKNDTGCSEHKREALADLIRLYGESLARERAYRRRNRLGEAGDTERERMSAAIHAMVKKYPGEVTITELADICSISADHFGKLFKKVFGVPPKEWMTHYRIYQAIALMSSNQSLGSISEMIGFGDQYYFSKVFKQFTGYSPTAYRKSFLRP